MAKKSPAGLTSPSRWKATNLTTGALRASAVESELEYYHSLIEGPNDVQADPWETRNLAGEAAHKQTLLRLRSKWKHYSAGLK